MSRRKTIQGFLLALILALITIGAIPALATDEKPILERNAQWKYYDQGQLLDDTWKNADFDDSSWVTGTSPLGFGDDYSETDPTLPIGTVVSYGDDGANKYMTTYFRTSIDAGDLIGYVALKVYVHVDDGCVVYVNGVEAFRKGIEDGPVAYDTAAKFKPKEETFSLPVETFVSGVNVIAAEVHQDGGDSSDLWFELGIDAVPTTSMLSAEPTPEVVAIPDSSAPLGEVSKVTVSFAGDTMTAKGFTWYTTLASASSDLEVVLKTDAVPDFVGAMQFSGRSAVSTNSATEVVHKAEAVGLKPGAEYVFRVGDAGLNLWSETGSFATATVDGAFSFIDLADSQAKNEEEAALAAHTFKKAVETVRDSSFIIINGDLVDTGLNEAQWNWLLGYAKDTFLNTTFASVAGNHDEDKNSFDEHFNLVPAPFSATESGVYYSFDYKNAHFIMLNTNEDSKEFADFTPAQVQWLKGDAIAAKVNGAQWLIAVIHKGPYTTSNHAEDADIQDLNGVRAMIAPLFNEVGVDLVLQGHDHIYARSKPIANGVAIVPEKTVETLNGQPIEYALNPQGTIYVIPATAGPKVYYKSAKMSDEYYTLFDMADDNHAAKYGADPEDASRPVRSAIQNFMGITIDGARLTAVAYEIDQNIDPEKAYIVDQFGISK